ncbi:MAG: PP2C family protein-serine/threonine phosphatase [Cyanophyceae cyanobacterium]
MGVSPASDSIPLFCVNPRCKNPQNVVGREACAECQEPLDYRYLWALGDVAAAIPVGSFLAGRYFVQAPSIWLDTQPHRDPWMLPQWPAIAQPYMKLHRYPFHVPRVYGACPMGGENSITDVVLLENAPIDRTGKLYPTLADAWGTARSLRRVSWFLQLLKLWPVLASAGVEMTVLSSQNVRVQGGRVWLRILENGIDAPKGTEAVLPSQVANTITPIWRKFGDLWYAWLTGVAARTEMDGAKRLVTQLQGIFEGIRQGQLTPAAAVERHEKLVRSQQVAYNLRCESAGLTDAGSERVHNEDAAFPLSGDMSGQDMPVNDGRLIAMVGDGIGGHEKGEVASELAVRSLSLQAQALQTNVATDPDFADGTVIGDGISAIMRVANNLVLSQNSEQHREARQRMGTTLTLALSVTQSVEEPICEIPGQVQDIYLGHVGDCRAYWLTADHCQLLTVDDDFAGQETLDGRGPYRDALGRSRGEALVQALGTKEGARLNIHTERFLVDENGLLLICSDGFSVDDWVERSWRRYVPAILRGDFTLEVGLRNWLSAAVRRNGSDNVTATLSFCQLIVDTDSVPDPWAVASTEGDGALAPKVWESEFSEASKVLLYGDSEEGRKLERRRKQSQRSRFQWATSSAAAIVAAAALVAGLVVGVFLWRSPAPEEGAPVPTTPELEPTNSPDISPEGTESEGISEPTDEPL